VQAHAPAQLLSLCGPSNAMDMVASRKPPPKLECTKCAMRETPQFKGFETRVRGAITREGCCA